MLLRYRKVRQLSVTRSAHPRGLPFLSAASGLVRVQERLYVIADDELRLGVFDVGSTRPLRLFRLLDGKLPADAKKRKAKKPDFESLLLLPPSENGPGGTLLALGSGSRPNRFIGALLRLDAYGDASRAARRIGRRFSKPYRSRISTVPAEGTSTPDDAAWKRRMNA